MKALNSIVVVFMSLFLLTVSTGSLVAGDFEGTVKQRYSYFTLDDVPHEFSSEQAAVDFIFSRSVEQLKSFVAENGGADLFEQQTTTIRIKGDRYRIDTSQEGQDVSLIYDLSNEKMITLQHAQKVAMETSMGEMMGMFDDMSDDDMDQTDRDQFSLQSTGKVKEIHGFQCREYVGTDEDGDYLQEWIHVDDIDWYASLVEAFQQMDMSGEGESEEMGKEEAFYRKVGGLPILSKVVSMGDVNINEILSIKSQSVGDDMFAIPEGYKKVNMQQMMQMQMDSMGQ